MHYAVITFFFISFYSLMWCAECSTWCILLFILQASPSFETMQPLLNSSPK